MAITDELRHNIEGAEQLYGRECPRLRAIADRIDAAHEEAIQREHETAYDSGYDEAMKSCENWAAGHEDEMAKSGWYQALDADKQPIKFSDEVEWRHPCGSCELRHGIVTGIKIDKIGDEVFHEVTVKVDRFTVRLMANQLWHYHKQPTVEDVLREFGKAWVEWEDGSPHDPIAEYAAKLRLADNCREQ